MSRLLEQWINGRGCPGTMVIDGHIHVGEWCHAATFHDADHAAAGAVRYMDANGVDAFCALSGGYMFGKSDYRLGNDFLLAVWKRLPDRMIPFMSVNPNDSAGSMTEELKRMYGAGVRCIKLINAYQGYPGDGPNLMALYEFAAKNNLLVINHHWSEKEISHIASCFPGVDFIFAHYWGGYQDDILVNYPNVYANIWNYGHMGWLERGIAKIGPGKFMLGSDGFLNCMSVGIGPVVFADISEDAKKLILGLTAARLLDKAGALPADLKQKYTALCNDVNPGGYKF